MEADVREQEDPDAYADFQWLQRWCGDIVVEDGHPALWSDGRDVSSGDPLSVNDQWLVLHVALTGEHAWGPFDDYEDWETARFSTLHHGQNTTDKFLKLRKVRWNSK